MERIHNEMRENLNARRGLSNDASSQQFMELFKIDHNFIRPHQTPGKAPAEAWSDKKIRGGINDILSLYGFSRDVNA